MECGGRRRERTAGGMGEMGERGPVLVSMATAGKATVEVLAKQAS